MSGLDAGIYTCVVTDNKGCLLTTSSIEITESTTGILEDQIEFEIYPNPTSDQLNIILVGSDAITMNLIDNTGRLVMTELLNNENNTIEVGHIASGIYNIQLRNSDGVVSVKQVVIE